VMPVIKTLILPPRLRVRVFARRFPEHFSNIIKIGKLKEGVKS
jgi:hypothetical protein